MTYKKYSCIIISATLLFYAANIIFWHLCVSKIFYTNDGHGDLSRLCSTQLAVVDEKNPHYSIRHTEFSDYLKGNTDETFDIITIGSSCSNGRGGAYYQDYLTENYNLRILNIPPQEYNPGEILAMLAQKGYLQKIKPTYVIVECVERNFQDITKWVHKISEQKAERFIYLSHRGDIDNIEQPGQLLPVIMINANIKFLLDKIHAIIYTDSLSTEVNVAHTTEKFFNGLKDEFALYYYFADLHYLRAEQDVIEINASLNRLSDFLAQRDIRFVFLGLPDKYSLYLPYTVNSADVTENPSFNRLMSSEKNYIFINAKDIFREALRRERIQDLWWGDDTHWSYKAHKIAGDYIVKTLFPEK